MSNFIIPQNPRKLKALQLLGASAVRPTIDPRRFIVVSQTTEGKEYHVDTRPSQPYCRTQNGDRCHDLKFNSPPEGKCKHILAVEARQQKRRDMQQFLSRRPDVTLQGIIDRMEKEITRWTRNLTFTHTEELAQANAKAFAHIARELMDEAQRTNSAQAERERALAFQVRFWWPDFKPEDLLDPINSFAANEPDRIEVHDHSGWRVSSEDSAGIRAYIEANNLIVGKPRVNKNSRHEGKHSQFIIPIYKEI